MREILETIARESANPTARVSAIRALRQLDEEGKDRQARALALFTEMARERQP
jgi:hypothetical protein